MKIIERLALSFSLIGLLMKVMIRTGANEMLMIGLTLLALLYLTFGFALFNNISFRSILQRSSYEHVSLGRILGAVGLGICLWINVTAILFKLLNLTGANEMLIIGIEVLTPVLVVALIIFMTKKNRHIDFYFKNVFIKGIAVLTIVVALFLLPRFTLVKLFHRDDAKYIELWIRSANNPDDQRAWQEFEEYKNSRAEKQPEK
jgi:hypothetical protein